MMANPFSRGLAWYRYKRLEEEFINATQFFPFEQRFEGIWSEFFSDFLTKICYSVEGVFRKMLDDTRFDSYSHVPSLKNSSQKINIHYFRDFFDPIYNFSKVKVRTAYGLTSYGTCQPFEGFLKKKYNRIPKWWCAYNRVKHGWFIDIEEATLKNTIEALAGLFVLNILHKESQMYLLKYQNVISGGVQATHDQLLYLFSKSIDGLKKNLTSFKFVARTPLFEYAF